MSSFSNKASCSIHRATSTMNYGSPCYPWQPINFSELWAMLSRNRKLNVRMPSYFLGSVDTISPGRADAFPKATSRHFLLYHKRERNLFLLSSEKMLSYHALPLSPPHQESKPVFPFEVTIYASGHRSLHSSQQCCRPLWHWSNHEVKNMARETDHRAGVNHAGKGKRLCWGKGLCRHESEAFSLRALG
jgi:hypothetical protein